MVKEISVTSVTDEGDPVSHWKYSFSVVEILESSTSEAPNSLGVSAATLSTGTTNTNVISSAGRSKHLSYYLLVQKPMQQSMQQPLQQRDEQSLICEIISQKFLMIATLLMNVCIVL